MQGCVQRSEGASIERTIAYSVHIADIVDDVDLHVASLLEQALFCFACMMPFPKAEVVASGPFCFGTDYMQFRILSSNFNYRHASDLPYAICVCDNHF